LRSFFAILQTLQNLSRRLSITGLALALCAITALSAQRRGGSGANASQATPPKRPNRIVGRIVGADGLAEKSVIVSLLQDHNSTFGRRVGLVDARLRVVPNERGEYSIDNVAPGSYYVVAIPVHEPVQRNGGATTSGHSITYYPSASDISAARQVSVTMSRPVVADITLRSTGLFTVSGTVRWSDGLPAASGGLGMSSDSHLFGLDGRSVAVQRDGTFHIGAVAPGRYCLQHVEQGGRGQQRLVSAARITVTSRDLTNVRVGPVSPIKVRGRLVLAAADRQRLASLAIRIFASPAAGGCYFGSSRSGTVNPSGAFEFFVEPIDGYIRLNVNGQEVRPIAVRHNSTAVPGGRFKFQTAMTGIEVELGPLPASVGRGR